MQISETAWVRQPQEREGTYWFSGSFYVTSGVKNLLDEIEIMAIYYEITGLAKQKRGLDFLQVYQRKSDQKKLFMIDHLTLEQVQSGEFKREDNYCTLLLASEY